MEEQTQIMLAQILIILLLLYAIYAPSQSKYLTNKQTVYWFHRPGCPHCDNMKGAWEQLNGVVSSKYELKAVNTSLPENSALAKKYGVSGVPHVVKTWANGHTVYKGDRSVADMKQWIESR
jgi:thioredoxin-related protein